MQDEAQYGPRFGDSPQPGHWAAGIGGFGGAAWLAHGFDCLAEEAGLADGLLVLLKGCGLTLGQVEAAEPWQFREWFYACYREYGGSPARHWDVVAGPGGILSPGSGWDLPRRQARPAGGSRDGAGRKPRQNRAATS